MASLTGNLVAETYKALLKTIDNDILTASEKQITDGLGGGSNVFIDSNGFLRANKYKVTNGLATQFLKADGSLDANTYLTSITGAQVITALGYTPVTDQRTLTINGVTYNLTANRSWTVAGTAAVWGNITGTLSNQTDLQAALNAKFNVPAGTISQYIRGDGTLATFPTLPGGLPIGGTAGQILSKIDATDYNAQWIDNFATQTKNEVKLGQTLAKGAAVYVSSANGTNIIVSAASNASESLSSKTFGLLETGGVTNDLVKCVTFGLLAGLDTSAAQAGDPVWLGVNGALLFGVANKPVAPANMVYIGVVTRVQQNNGEIFVNVQNGFEIEELHDVLIQSKANNQGLFYESSTGLWKNKSIATVLGYTPQAQLDGTGFVKASGTTISYDNSTYLTTADAASTYLTQTTAASTYQRLDKMVSNLLASDTEYPNSNAVIAALALKANAANPVFTGNMTISGAEPKLFFTDTDNNPDYTIFIDSGIFYIYDQTAGTTRFSISSTGNISAGVGKSITADSFIKDGGTASQFLKADGTIDSNTYVSSSALANYLLITTAASTYQRLDKMVSNLLASDTEYPNSNAVLAKLALKADAANPVFTGDLSISGATPRLYFVDTDQNPDYTVFIDSGFFYIYDQTAGATRFSINSSGNISTGVGKSITAGSFVRDGGTASQFLMADGSVTTGVVTGSGTTNYLPKWTSASGLGNSIVSDDGTTLNISGALNTYGGTGGIKSALYFRNTWNDTQYPTLYSTTSAEFIMIHLPHLPYLQNGTYGYTAGTYGSIVRHAGQPTVTSFWDSGILGLQGITDAYAISRNDGAPFFYIASTGNINIGAATDAGYKLNVNGTGRFNGNVLISKSSEATVELNSTTAASYSAFFHSENGTAKAYWEYLNSSHPTTSRRNYLEAFNLVGGFAVYAAGAKALDITTTGAATFSSTIAANTNILVSSISNAGLTVATNSTTGFSYLDLINNGASGRNYQIGVGGNGVAAAYANNLYIDLVGVRNIITLVPSGNVGIGTNSPTALLHLLQNTTNLNLYLQNTNGSGKIWAVNSDNNGSFNIHDTVANRLTILSGGNVGIGTTNPTVKLTVSGGSIQNNIVGTTSSHIQLANSNGSTYFGNDAIGGYLYTDWNSPFLFYTNNTEKIRLTSVGNLLIGTQTDSGFKLRVNGTGFFDGALGANGGAGGGTSINLFYKTTWGGTQYPTIYGGSTAEFFMMHLPHVPYLQTGVNGYSGANYGSLVRFAGQAAATSYWDAGVGACGVGVDKFVIGRNESALFTITNAGNVTATAFFESSDIRLKTLIENNPIIDGIEKLDAKLYEKNGKIELGYFAQDAESIMPHAIQIGTDGFLSLSYREVHTAKIARLEKEVAELKEKLNLN